MFVNSQVNYPHARAIKTRVFILACSIKHGNYCVAGLRLANEGSGNNSFELIRLVTDDQNTDGAVSPDLLLKDGRTAGLFDSVEFYLKPAPSLIQPENYLIQSSCDTQPVHLLNLKKVYEYSYNEKSLLLTGIAQNVMHSDYIFYNNDKYIAPEVLNRQLDRHSLEIRFINRVELYINSNNKTRARFVYKNRVYSSISVTDPFYFNLPYNQTVIINNCLALFSIGQPFIVDGMHYKFLACIIPIENIAPLFSPLFDNFVNMISYD